MVNALQGLQHIIMAPRAVKATGATEELSVDGRLEPLSVVGRDGECSHGVSSRLAEDRHRDGYNKRRMEAKFYYAPLSRGPAKSHWRPGPAFSYFTPQRKRRPKGGKGRKGFTGKRPCGLRANERSAHALPASDGARQLT